MAVHKYSAGLSNVGSYQVSGRPWITGSSDLDAGKVHLVMFPRVTKSITIVNNNTNNGDDIRVHFQSGSDSAVEEPGKNITINADADSDVIRNNHYMTVPSGYGSLTMDVKCKRMYISNPPGANNNLKYQVVAELTQIGTGSMFPLTGSGVTAAGEGHHVEAVTDS